MVKLKKFPLKKQSRKGQKDQNTQKEIKINKILSKRLKQEGFCGKSKPKVIGKELVANIVSEFDIYFFLNSLNKKFCPPWTVCLPPDQDNFKYVRIQVQIWPDIINVFL